ncbi:glycosyltransferase family 2 protein [Jannaschia ovalis]|uniref:Glycosyltransferase n=1 Tax=Jannaschia ovalis TaxID=3038773 RepID=A0ABY8LAZ7_9RHOB|nr:glycosyltransferase [Jannaschia sp. GRR-S6-38]WGH78441.1 glycosyltransferase [Jannaschia sp. GRR-S6-38]
MSELGLAIDFLGAQSGETLFALFWFVVVIEMPRYLLLFATITILPRPRPHPEFEGALSVMIAGHCEAETIERCVAALREQSRPPDQIVVVSDGSSDAMQGVMRDMLRRGLIDEAHATDLRSGKSAGVNMAARSCTGDILVNVDSDCSFDRHALRELVRPFNDPAVGAVCGCIRPRNRTHGLVTRFQAIEYLTSISLGRQAADRIGQVSCVSGAFGAFRRDAYLAAGGLDAGGGEDLDLTLRLRQRGWAIRFAAAAICYTDVPATLRALVRQRFRWERDAIRLRYRKHRGLMNPFSNRFRLSGLFNEVEFLLFNVVAAIALPVYLAWLVSIYGTGAWTILLAAQIGLLGLDAAVLAMAAALSPGSGAWRLFADLPGYSLFNGLFMRFVRLAAYAEEWIFHASYADSYVPDKVHRVRE